MPFSLRRSPSGTALFVLPSFTRPRYNRVEEMRRREESEETERERGEDSSSFFWMSQAQVRRGGKDEQEAG